MVLRFIYDDETPDDTTISHFRIFRATNVELEKISTFYKAVLRDIHRMSTEEANIALDKRYIIERRFGTLVRKHGLFVP